MRLPLCLLLISVLTVSCKKADSVSETSAVQYDQVAQGTYGGSAEAVSEKSANAPTNVSASERSGETPVKSSPEISAPMLIKTGTVSFQVKSFQKAKAEISATIPRFGAYISSENESSYNNSQQCVMTVRIPAEKFDLFVSEISKSADHFDQKQITVEDVGEEFADVTARMKAKKEVELRYIAILAKANKISEILEIEQKIGEVRAEIESMQGRLNFLKSQVSYSTLTITFYEQHDLPITQRENFFARILTAFVNGWQGMLNFLVEITGIWPFVLAAGIVAVIIRKMKKQRRQKTKEQHFEG